MADEQYVSQGGVTVGAEIDESTRVSQGGVTVAGQVQDSLRYEWLSHGGITVGVDEGLATTRRYCEISHGGITVFGCPPLEAATDLSAIGYSDHVDLAWTDNVTGVSNGYRIERKVNAGAWATLDTVDPDEESYTDNAIAPGNTYTYRIVTLNGLCETLSAEVVASFSSLNVYGVSYE